MTKVRIYCVGLFSGIMSLSIAETALGQGNPYDATTWNSTIKIPPGGYRSAKPINLTGTIDITTMPWSTVEEVAFNGTANDQHWHYDGTILKRVTISGQLGVSLEAKDSVFEGCEMSKTGGWFVDMWGSHWNFDNCIFTEKFMGGKDLSETDYQIHANRCTFYDVKLPSIGLKGDPGGYLQTKNMGFVKCHFVRCVVPKTFLAATADCVFEDCQFSTKHQVWPDGMTPVKVNALCSGLSDPPDSYEDGPVSVQFAAAPQTIDAGSALEHTESGGEVILKNYTPPMEYANFGTVVKKSSEVKRSLQLTN
jgi:hypothetical protein